MLARFSMIEVRGPGARRRPGRKLFGAPLSHLESDGRGRRTTYGVPSLVMSASSAGRLPVAQTHTFPQPNITPRRGASASGQPQDHGAVHPTPHAILKRDLVMRVIRSISQSRRKTMDLFRPLLITAISSPPSVKWSEMS